MSEAKVGSLDGEFTSSKVTEHFVYVGNMYIGKDLKTYHSMDLHGFGGGGTYFKTEKEAQALADKYNGVFRVEEGKYYKTNEGKKIGPMVRNANNSFAPFRCNKGWNYDADGVCHNLGKAHERSIVSEWVEEPEAPKLWKDMTPEERGALLLAHHEGKVIEWTRIPGDLEFLQNSAGTGKPIWDDQHAYRIKPVPTVETVTLYGYIARGYFHESSGELDTHKITLTITDGEVGETAKVEKI